jgi:hypothetical protein
VVTWPLCSCCMEVGLGIACEASALNQEANLDVQLHQMWHTYRGCLSGKQHVQHHQTDVT